MFKSLRRSGMLLLYNSPVSRRVPLFLFLLLLFSLSTASAQHSSDPQLSYKLLSVRVKGLHHFKEDQVVSASGLKLGQLAGEDEFKQALQKLGETGLFSNLTYAYRYSRAGCDLEIQVSENQKLLPIVFDNFVWFSDEELIKLLRPRIPLFEGRLPEAGNLADQVSDALNAVLAERTISGHSEYLRAESVLNGPVDSYVYTITSHPVIVNNITIPGSAPPELPALEAAAKPLSGQEYLRSKMRSQAKNNFLPVYLSRGYLKARFEDPQAKVVKDGPRTEVDVTLPVNPGVQYKLTKIGWSGNALFPSEKLQPMIHLRTGDPANAVQLDQDIGSLQNLYGTKGYLNARVVPTPLMDDSKATVSYQLNVIEGDLYRMADLEIDGIDSAAIQRIMTQWQMKKGDPYDNGYLTRFFQLMYRDTSLSRSYAIAPKATINQQEKSVSVALHFMPK